MSRGHMQQHMTDEQIARVEIVIKDLAKCGNAWGIGIGKQIAGKQPEQKRRLILGAVGQMWEAMLSIQMAMDSTRTPEQVRQALQQGRRR